MRSVLVQCGCDATVDGDGGGYVDVCPDHTGDVAHIGRLLASLMPDLPPAAAFMLAHLMVSDDDED